MKRAAVAWLFFVLIAVGSFYEALKLPFGRTNAPGAGFFPAVLAALLAVVALAGLIAGLRAGGKQEGEDSRLVWKKIILTVTALFAFAFWARTSGLLPLSNRIRFPPYSTSAA